MGSKPKLFQTTFKKSTASTVYLFAQDIHFRWLVTSRNSAKRGECSLHHDGNMFLLFGCSFIESWFLELEIFWGKQPWNLDTKPEALKGPHICGKLDPVNNPEHFRVLHCGGVFAVSMEAKVKDEGATKPSVTQWYPSYDWFDASLQSFPISCFSMFLSWIHAHSPNTHQTPGIKAGNEGIMNNIPW